MHRQFAQKAVQDLAANIVPQHIDSAGGEIAQAGANIFGLVVDRGIEAEFAHQPVALVSTSGDADHPATGDLADLADDRTRRTGSPRHDERITGKRPSDLVEAEIGRHSRGAENAEMGGQQFGVFDFQNIGGGNRGIILPTGSAGHLVAGFEAARLRSNHFRNSRAAHDFTQFGRRHIAADILHPALLRRIETEIERAQENLTRLGVANGRFGPFEIAILERAAGGPPVDQPLAIDLRHLRPFLLCKAWQTPVIPHRQYSPSDRWHSCSRPIPGRSQQRRRPAAC